MADLSPREKRDLEELLQMRMGFVLGFSNRTFQEFVHDSTGLNIYDETIGGSGSKASRLRYFWEHQPDKIVGRLLKDLVARVPDASPLKDRCAAVADRLLQRARGATRRYYAARKQPGQVTLEELYQKLQSLYLFFRERDYFKEAGITKTTIPDEIKHKAALCLSFQMFPVTQWTGPEVTEDHIFEALEFLHDHVSRPGVWTEMSTASGYTYNDYDGYDADAGQAE